MKWYALAVHARRERAAAAALLGVVDDVFLPMQVERRAWSDRIHRVEVPLFAGYLFVRLVLSAESRVDLLKAKPTIDLVGRRAGARDIAPSIPDDEIASLRTLLAAQRAVDPVERMVPGVAVVVGAGPLQGVRGVVERAVDGQRRLVVQVSLLGRGVRTILMADDVLEEPATPRIS
jgi:transcription antitermination factor NusG